MVKFITADQAAALIPDGATVGIGGMGLSGWPEEVACAMRDRFLRCGHPRALNLRQGCDLGDWVERGVSRLGEAGEGLVAKWCCAHMGSAYAMHKLVEQNKVECYFMPQGVILNLWREIGAGRPGLLTKVGLGTFIDPRYGGGRINAAAREDLAELVSFQGEEYLFYKSFPVDVALIRGTTADECGNITFERESLIHEGYEIANAAKNSGGIVIVQVEYLAKADTLDPRTVRIPGVLVDYVVVATDESACWQEERTRYNPALSGQLRAPVFALAPEPLDERKVICRRCAMELRRGYLINQGVGIPSGMARVLSEEGLLHAVTTSAESGAIGGITAFNPSAAYNVQSFISHPDMFNLIDGGGLDLTCLGIGQIDRFGNNNVHKFGPKLKGCGGFIDLTSATPRILFCGTMMTKARFRIGDGEIHVAEEGKNRKFVGEVEQITFSAAHKREDQEVIYITERCVLRLIDGRLVLTEIAPGLDLERDVLACMDFRPEISPDLKLMPAEIFREHWGGLEKYLDLPR